jgi:hypothetical protein
MPRKIVLILAIALVATSCSSSVTPTTSLAGATSAAPVPLQVTPPWQGSEHAEYNIIKDSDQAALGTGTIDIQPASGVTTIEQRYQIGAVNQHLVVEVDAQTLKPLTSTQEITGSPNDFSLTATYAANKLAITAKTAQGDKSTTIDVDADAYDNNSLLAILRGFPFGMETAASFTNVVTANAAQVKSTAAVAAQESVTVPAGTFDTYKVILGFGGTQQTAWYEVATPHHLIKYDNGTTQFVLTK